MTTTDPAAQHIPEDAMRRLAEMRPGQATSLFTSDLCVNEFLLVREAGFRPLGPGARVEHLPRRVPDGPLEQEPGAGPGCRRRCTTPASSR